MVAENKTSSYLQAIQSTLFQVYQLTMSSNRGTTTKTAADARLLQFLSDNQVPAQWKKLWNGPKLATNYLKAMSIRAVATEQRLSQAWSPNPKSAVDLSRIYNVDTFFTTLKLIAARDYPEDISTTEITLTLRLVEAAASKTDLNSIAIAPLIIEGGLNFDNTTGMLTKVRASRRNKEVPLTPELILVFSRTESPSGQDSNDDEDGEELSNECIVPLYTNSSREKMICSFKLPIENNLSTLATYSSLALIVPDQPVE